MSLADDLVSEVAASIAGERSWNIQDGRVIPETADVGLGLVGKRIELVVLYSDIANSTDLVRRYCDWFVAGVAKAFLICAVRIIRDHDGIITSFDGDRVMAVFHGDRKNTNAAEAALKINWAVSQVINPRIRETYHDMKEFCLGHCTGVDRSRILVTRSGIRNNNDLVWIGRAANYAAKLSEERGSGTSIVTKDVYAQLRDEAKYSSDIERRCMWEPCTIQVAGIDTACHSSTWWWRP